MTEANTAMMQRMLSIISDLNERVARLTAIEGLNSFIIMHLLDQGNLANLSSAGLDQLARIVSHCRSLAAESGDPDCIEPMIDLLDGLFPEAGLHDV